MASRLYRVPECEPVRRDSLRERAGEATDEAVDAYMRREFGRQAFALSAQNIAAFDIEGSSEAKRIIVDGTVGVVYDGIDEVIMRRQPHTKKQHLGFDVVEPEVVTVARFSTSHGPADISNRLRKKMDKNDMGSMNLACLYAIIGIALDEPVSFTPLVDGTIEEEKPKPAQLRMVH